MRANCLDIPQRTVKFSWESMENWFYCSLIKVQCWKIENFRSPYFEILHRLLWQTYVVENFYTVGELSYKYFGALEKFFSLKGKRNLATWKKIGKFSTQFLEIRLEHHRTSPVVNFHLDLTNKQFLTPLYRFRVENIKKIDGQKLHVLPFLAFECLPASHAST